MDALIKEEVVAPSGQLGQHTDPDPVILFNFSQNFPEFAAMPGSGNLYLSGKLDSGTVSCDEGKTPPPCEAVFWDLHFIQSGATVDVYWEKQKFSYVVTALCSMPREGGQLDKVLAKTDTPRVTLTTAGGTFDGRGYPAVNIVIAEEGGSGQSTCPEGTTEGLIPPKPLATPTRAP